MKVVFMAGSHPRHAAMARALYSTGALAGLIIEKRDEHVPTAPDNLEPGLKKLFDLHFAKRAEAEDKFFGEGILPDVEIMNVTQEALNDAPTQDFIKKHQPDLLLSYGVHMLTDEVIYSAPGERWNVHGGLSPMYRGCITHFWPSYLLEPQMTGMTVHNLTQQLDAGDVVHQNAAPLVRGDGIHDLACRAVAGLVDEMPKLVEKLAAKQEIPKHAHKTTGKIWTTKDWKPENLRLVYELYDDKIVDRALDGAFEGGRQPRLHRQFD